MMHKATDTEYLIIGAGVSGLAFANFARNASYLIAERENEPGGYCRTVFKNGFVWDYSGHFFHFRDPSVKKFIADRMPEKSLVNVVKNAKIYYKGRYIDFPFQKNIHQLEKSEFIECLSDLYFAGRSGAKTFKEMVYSNYGNAIAQKFLIPYNEKLYACNLDTLDKDAMGRFFPEVRFDEIMRHFTEPDNSSYNSHFTYPKKGAIEYIHALLRNLKKDRILLDEAIVRIDYAKKIAYTAKREIRYKKIISSTPFPKLLDLCRISYPAGIFSSNKVLAFNLGFDRKGNSEHHWVYFPDKKTRFYRIGYYDNILHTGRMSIYVEIGMATNEKVNPEKELSTVLKQLKENNLITDHKLVAHHHVVMDPAYVHINKRSQKLFAARNKFLMSKDIYSIGRYGGWKYCSIEDNIIEAKQLAKKLNSSQ